MPNKPLIVGTVDYEEYRADVAEETCVILSEIIANTHDCYKCPFCSLCDTEDSKLCSESIVEFARERAVKYLENK